MKPEALASCSEWPCACGLASQFDVAILVIPAWLSHLCAAAVSELTALTFAFVVCEAFPSVVEVLSHWHSFDAIGCYVFSRHSRLRWGVAKAVSLQLGVVPSIITVSNIANIIWIWALEELYVHNRISSIMQEARPIIWKRGTCQVRALECLHYRTESNQSYK